MYDHFVTFRVGVKIRFCLSLCHLLNVAALKLAIVTTKTLQQLSDLFINSEFTAELGQTHNRKITKSKVTNPLK